MWNDIAQLRQLGLWLQWIAIALVFIGGILQVAKFAVDRREKALITLEQVERQKPKNQIVTSGSATIEVTTDSADTTNSHFMDSGGVLGFGKGSTALMAFHSIDSFGVQNGKNEVVWKAVLALDAGDPSIGKPVGILREADYIQVEFGPMPKDAKVKSGNAVITLNGNLRLVVDIPAQQLKAGHVLVPNLAAFKTALE